MILQRERINSLQDHILKDSIFITFRERCGWTGELYRASLLAFYLSTIAPTGHAQWEIIWLTINHMGQMRSSQWHSMNWTTPWWEDVYAFACLWIHMPGIWWRSLMPVPQPTPVLACFVGLVSGSAQEAYVDLDWGQWRAFNVWALKICICCFARKIIVLPRCLFISPDWRPLLKWNWSLKSNQKYLQYWASYLKNVYNSKAILLIWLSLPSEISPHKSGNRIC